MASAVLVLASGLLVARGTTGDAADVPPSFTRITVDQTGSGDCKALADIDGDGRLDGIIGGKDLSWYTNPGGDLGAPWPHHVIRVADNEYTTQCQAVDVDGDGAPDIVSPDDGTLWWFRNPRGRGGDPTVPAQWERVAIGRPVGYFTHDVAVGDLNGDGKMDVITKSPGALETWTQTTSGWTEARLADRGGEGMVVGDVDGDGRPDIVAGGYWYHNPDWVERPITAMDNGSPAIVDVDGDGHVDVVLAPMESFGSEVDWWSVTNPTGSAIWTKHVIDADGGVAFHNIAVADFNGDALVDVLVPHMFGDVDVYVNPGSSGTWASTVISTDGGHNLVSGDLNGDGRPDVFGSNYVGNPPVWAWRNDTGTTTTTTSPTTTTTTQPTTTTTQPTTTTTQPTTTTTAPPSGCVFGAVCEAEDASYPATVAPETDWCPCSGGSALGDFREPGEYVTWTVAGVPAAGTYDVAFRYGAGDGAVSRRFEVNGAVVNRNLRFPRTSSWAAWTTLHVSTRLRAGTNTITLRATSFGNYLNLDYLQVTGGAAVAPASPLSPPALPGGGGAAW